MALDHLLSMEDKSGSGRENRKRRRGSLEVEKKERPGWSGSRSGAELGLGSGKIFLLVLNCQGGLLAQLVRARL